jgi:hypothetical protein
MVSTDYVHVWNNDPGELSNLKEFLQQGGLGRSGDGPSPLPKLVRVIDQAPISTVLDTITGLTIANPPEVSSPDPAESFEGM